LLGRGLKLEQLETVDVPGVVLPLREIRGGFVDLRNHAETFVELALREMAQRSRLHLRDESQHLVSDTLLGLRDLFLREALAHGKEHGVEHLGREAELRVRHARRVLGPSHQGGKRGIGEPARLDEVSLREFQPFECRSQRAAVEQRDLHRALDREFARE